METVSILNRIKLFFQWIFVNTFGMIIVTPIVTIFSFAIVFPLLSVLFGIIWKLVTLIFTPSEPSNLTLTGQILQAAITFPLPWGAFRILIAGFLSFPFGNLQWFVLQKYIVDLKRWIWAGFIGLVVGVVIIEGGNYLFSDWKTSEIMLNLITGAIIGITLGTAQWFILRQHVKFSSLWVLANILGLSLGTAWGWPYFSNNPTDDIGILYYFVVFVFRLMITHSVITGILLIWPFNYPSKNLQKTAA